QPGKPGRTGISLDTRGRLLAAAPAGDIKAQRAQLFCGILSKLAKAEDADPPVGRVFLIELAPLLSFLLGAVVEVAAVQAQYLQDDVFAHRRRHMRVDEPDDREVPRQKRVAQEVVDPGAER